MKLAITIICVILVVGGWLIQFPGRASGFGDPEKLRMTIEWSLALLTLGVLYR